LTKAQRQRFQGLGGDGRGGVMVEVEMRHVYPF
jgi:hypothetical protein